MTPPRTWAKRTPLVRELWIREMRLRELGRPPQRVRVRDSLKAVAAPVVAPVERVQERPREGRRTRRTRARSPGGSEDGEPEPPPDGRRSDDLDHRGAA